MDREQWVRYFNRHIGPARDLPRLDRDKLERWERVRALMPSEGEYHRIDLDRTLALLMLERALGVELEVGSS